ncbi:MAG: hydroxyethylthiazole kinase [Candidatus Dormibacteraeota bacterium]|nr:hydroxyethylthiazole kinase [Candidatus Dormibacteraeota bacterium]
MTLPTITPGDSLRRLRAAPPLVHQITNFVVMNETANATLALGGLPVMAHAPEEVAEMASIAGALVLNIGTLTTEWVDSMFLAGRAANSAGVPVVLDPVGVGATRLRTESARRILREVQVTVLRGNLAEVATLAGLSAEIRGVEAIGAADDIADIARAAASTLGLVAAVTGPVDAVSDGDVVLRVSNGHPMLATVTGTGCIASALTGCILAVNRDRATGAAAEALVLLGIAGEDAAVGARGPGSFHVNLYDALAALSPDTVDERARCVPG